MKACKGCGSADDFQPYTVRPPHPREHGHRCGPGCDLNTLICFRCRLITGETYQKSGPEHSERVRKAIRKAVNLKW